MTATPRFPRCYQLIVEGPAPGDLDDLVDHCVIGIHRRGTVIRGQIADQTALYGLLRRLRDNGLDIWSLNCLPTPYP